MVRCIQRSLDQHIVGNPPEPYAELDRTSSTVCDWWRLHSLCSMQHIKLVMFFGRVICIIIDTWKLHIPWASWKAASMSSGMPHQSCLMLRGKPASTLFSCGSKRQYLPDLKKYVWWPWCSFKRNTAWMCVLGRPKVSRLSGPAILCSASNTHELEP